LHTPTLRLIGPNDYSIHENRQPDRPHPLCQRAQPRRLDLACSGPHSRSAVGTALSLDAKAQFKTPWLALKEKHGPDVALSLELPRIPENIRPHLLRRQLQDFGNNPHPTGWHSLPSGHRLLPDPAHARDLRSQARS